MTWKETRDYLNQINEVLPWLDNAIVIGTKIDDHDKIPQIHLRASDFDKFVQKIGMVPTVDTETNEYRHEGVTFMNVHVVCCKFKEQ